MLEGVGLQLGWRKRLKDGPYVQGCGIDLDCCIDPATGEIEPWAVEIIERLGSYTEVSPSGTGLKIFFLMDFAHYEEVNALADGGKLFIRKESNGRHNPSIEVYYRARYFTVTLKTFDGRDPRVITLADWHWLLEEAGPKFNGTFGKKAEKREPTCQPDGSPWPPTEVAQVESALARLDEEDAVDGVLIRSRDRWLAIGMALHDLSEKETREGVNWKQIWFDWSAKSVNDDLRDNIKHWRGFNRRSRKGGTRARKTIASVFHAAKELGWQWLGVTSLGDEADVGERADLMVEGWAAQQQEQASDCPEHSGEMNGKPFKVENPQACSRRIGAIQLLNWYPQPALSPRLFRGSGTGG